MSCEDPGAVLSPVSDPDTLDLTGQALEKLTRATPELILNTTTLLLDNNNLVRLDNIHTYQCLEKVNRNIQYVVKLCRHGRIFSREQHGRNNNRITGEL